MKRRPAGYLGDDRDGDDLPEALQGDLPAEQRQLRVAARKGLTMTPAAPFAVRYDHELITLRPSRDFLAPEHPIVLEHPLDFDAVAPRFASRRCEEVRAYTVTDGEMRLMSETNIGKERER